jgi:hypothetical protein
MCLGADGCDIRRGPERAHAGAEAGARGYRGWGINKSSPILVICQSLFQISSLSQHAQSALHGTIVLELGLSACLGGGLCPWLFVTCLLGIKCVYTTMSRGSDRSGGKGPNRGGGQSGGKRPMYEGLDAPESTDWLTLLDSGTGSSLGGPSSSQKRSKHADVNEKNPGYPLRRYTAFARPVAMRYYAHRDMDMLERTFLDNGLDGYVDLCKDLCREFMEACDTSEQFNNYLDY